MNIAAPIDAWWLPGWKPSATTEWFELERRGVRVRAPRLSPDEVNALCERLRANRERCLRRQPVNDIIQSIGATINRWLDPFSAELHLACTYIPAFTGYPEPAVRKGLAGLLSSFRAENLGRLLRDELGDPLVLDEFRPRLAGLGQTRATGPGLVVHSFSGNIPGLPAQSLTAAMLAKAASLGKVAADEPIFAPLFARSLAAIDPNLADCLAVTYWPGDVAITGPTAVAAWSNADAVIAYGSDAAIDAVRQYAPANARVITYGHKLSFGVVARESLRPTHIGEAAARAAYDVCRFDQQGCLSPHVFYVECAHQTDAHAFASELASALADWTRAMPRGAVNTDELVSLARLRRQQEFRAAQGHALIYGATDDDWCVLFDEDPTFRASCLNRTVWVLPIPELSALEALLQPVRRYLQTAGVAVGPDRISGLADVLTTAGLDRICPLGQMGDAPPTWHHDGRFHVLDLLRFTDLEPETTAGRWEFLHPSKGVLGVARGANVVRGDDNGHEHN